MVKITGQGFTHGVRAVLFGLRRLRLRHRHASGHRHAAHGKGRLSAAVRPSRDLRPPFRLRISGRLTQTPALCPV